MGVRCGARWQVETGQGGQGVAGRWQVSIRGKVWPMSERVGMGDRDGHDGARCGETCRHVHATI